MRIVFFSVHAAIWPHALPENRVVRELVKAGHEVTYVTCSRAFRDHCTSMSAFGYEPSVPDETKASVCLGCAHNAAILAHGNGARHIQLANYLTEEDEREVNAFVSAVPSETYLDATWDGIPIGRLASYELFLKYKKMSTVLLDEEWAYFQTYLRNSLRSGLGFRKILAQTKPDVVFCYSPQYAVNGVSAELAIRSGATVYFEEGSSNNVERYKALRIWDWGKNGLLNPALLHWHEAELCISSEDVRRVNGHFEELFAGTSFAAYSSPLQQHFSTREFFGVPEGAKLLLATLSSFDEAFAAVVIEKFPSSKLKSEVFKDQFEWIEKTFAYIESRSDIFLVVRVHPRDYPNKRESVQSEQASHWEKILENRPKNVAINWPNQNISLYNILSDVDAVLTGWSATGVEALAFGIPVITYDKGLPSYPPEIQMTGEHEQQYYANLDRVASIPRGSEHVINAYKWLAITFSMGTVRISRRYWAERLADFAKRHIQLSPVHVAKIDAALLRFHARQAMPDREDAARLRELVETRAPDLIDVAIRGRRARSAQAVAKTVAGELKHLWFAGGQR